MIHSSSISCLAAALTAAQGEMPVAVFDASNPFLKSKYASLGAVIQASRPILAKHKLSLLQFPVSGGGDAGHGPADSVGIESVLIHASGEFIAESVSVLISEEKGKSRVQAVGSALTYLRRYSWASILGMYSDEDSDGCVPHRPLGPNHQPVPTKPASAGKLPVPTMPPPPMHPHKNI